MIEAAAMKKIRYQLISVEIENSEGCEIDALVVYIIYSDTPYKVPFGRLFDLL